MNRQIGVRNFKYVGKIWPVRIGHVIRHMRMQFLETHCQWYPMGDVRTHNSRTDSLRIFKLCGGVDHVTRHVQPLTKVKRSKVKVVT